MFVAVVERQFRMVACLVMMICINDKHAQAQHCFMHAQVQPYLVGMSLLGPVR